MLYLSCRGLSSAESISMSNRFDGLKQNMPGVPREWVERLIESDDNTDALAAVAIPGSSTVPSELGLWRHTGLTAGVPVAGELNTDSLDPTAVTELKCHTVSQSPGNTIAEMFNKFTGGESYFIVYDCADYAQFYIFRMDEVNNGVLIPPGSTVPVTFAASPVSGTITSLREGLYAIKVLGTASVSHILHTFNFGIASFSGTDYRSYPVGEPYDSTWTTGFATDPTVDRGGIMLPIAGPEQNIAVSAWIRSTVGSLVAYTLTCWKVERTSGSATTTVTKVSEIIMSTVSSTAWTSGIDITSGTVSESDLIIVGIKNHFGTAGGLDGQLVVKVV